MSTGGGTHRLSATIYAHRYFKFPPNACTHVDHLQVDFLIQSVAVPGNKVRPAESQSMLPNVMSK